MTDAEANKFVRQCLTDLELTYDVRTHYICKFCTLEVGTGAEWSKLQAFCLRLKGAGIGCKLTSVTNSEHKDYGKTYVEVESFWLIPELMS